MGMTCWGTLPVPGESTDITPYRAELFGILAMRTKIEMLQGRWQVKAGEVKLYVDNQKARETTGKREVKVNQSRKHADAIREIKAIAKKSKVASTHHHVHGH